MMSTMEPSGTRTTLATTIESPNNKCMDLKNFEWIITYQVPYMWFIFVLGFIENLFVISVFVLHKSRCTVAEIYLGNMAAADLIFVCSLPFGAVYIFNNFYWPFGVFMCKAVNLMFILNLYSSIYFLMMVSIDRYLALVKPMSIGLMRRPWWAKVNCGIIWMFAAILSLPSGLFRKVKFVDELNTTACAIETPSRNWNVARNIIMNVVGFLVPVVIIGFCTSQIIRVLRKNAKEQLKQVNTERRATRLVLSVLLVFTVCWLPFHISTFIYMLDKFRISLPCMVTSVNHIVHQLSNYIVLSNSCINPVLYSMVGNHFRQKAREVYSRLLGRRPDRRRP